jgi:hypothetical protein
MARWTVVLLVALAGCADDTSDRPTRHDCEAVLAHLIVLETPAVDSWGSPVKTLCKYHPSCDGSERKRFMQMCPKVLSRRELRCYQRATSLTLADACLPRTELDERIMTGEGGGGGRGYGGGGRGPAWLGLGGGGGRAPEVKPPDDLVFAFPDDGFGKPPSVSGIPECDEYIALMERYVMCDQIPHSMRDSTRDSIRDMTEAWKSMAGMDAETRRMAGDACRQAVTSIRDAASSMGCKI